MTDVKEDAWGKNWVESDDGDILNEWALASVPDLQAESFGNETTSASSEEGTWDQTGDGTEGKTPTVSNIPELISIAVPISFSLHYMSTFFRTPPQ